LLKPSKEKKGQATLQSDKYRRAKGESWKFHLGEEKGEKN